MPFSISILFFEPFPKMYSPLALSVDLYISYQYSICIFLFCFFVGVYMSLLLGAIVLIGMKYEL